MARGRMLNKFISVRDKMAALPNNTSRLIDFALTRGASGV